MKRDLFKEAMGEPKREKGAFIPLFDRLIDENPEQEKETPSKRYYNQLELVQSIEQEVSRILNTRSTAKDSEFEDLIPFQENIGLVHLFGLADFSQFDGSNRGHFPRIARLCEIAIRSFEPRLNEVQVTPIEFDRKSQTLKTSIKAMIVIPGFQQEITFPMSIAI